MSDGLAHCRLISVVKIFEMIKQPPNVIFDIVIALKIGIHNFTHAQPWIDLLLKFHSGIFRLFCIAKNQKFRENVVTARAESIFTAYVIVPLTFNSSMRQSYDTGCLSSWDAQFNRTLLYVQLYRAYVVCFKCNVK